MIRILFKCIMATFSVTLMLFALAYVAQSRQLREATPTRIGEDQAEKPFFVEFTQARQEVLMGYLREKFPSLNLPEPEPEPVNSLSLKALKDRTFRN